MKEIEWLEKNMNKLNLFYFEENGMLIDCYLKNDNFHICVFYKDAITNLLEDKECNNVNTAN